MQWPVYKESRDKWSIGKGLIHLWWFFWLNSTTCPLTTLYTPFSYSWYFQVSPWPDSKSTGTKNVLSTLTVISRPVSPTLSVLSEIWNNRQILLWWTLASVPPENETSTHSLKGLLLQCRLLSVLTSSHFNSRRVCSFRTFSNRDETSTLMISVSLISDPNSTTFHFLQS